LLNEEYSAPWDLAGGAYIFVYHFSREFRRSLKFRVDNSAGDTTGFGAVMIINYTTSNVGPYNEILFDPGKSYFLGKKAHSITKIYVSSQASLTNGRRNWGIPKELATFSYESLSKNEEHITVQSDGIPFFDVVIKTRAVRLPLNMKIIKFPMVQILDQKTFSFTIWFDGKCNLAKIESLQIDQERFPDISNEKPFIGFHSKAFKLVFPVAEVHDLGVPVYGLPSAYK